MSTRKRERNKPFLVILLLLIVSLINGLSVSEATNHFQLLFVSLPLVVVGLWWLCMHLVQLPDFTFKGEQPIKTTLHDIQHDRSNLRARELLLNSLPVWQRSS